MNHSPCVPTPADLVDLADGDQVLDFVYEYLSMRAIAPTDAAVHEVASIIARCERRSIARGALLSMVVRQLAY